MEAKFIYLKTSLGIISLIILITAYSKTDKENITQAERNELKQLMPNLIEKYKSEL